ncbi:uncharacterized protein LOC122926914 [Bufo gargarizans]|uniref:uncharacterized protein LOC122926914 n=1 Tax=Bufo gargarizans TaxID=30331 RepID=UPI001CF3147A|nr:uncharacterized protein LOC122926914 [Bufo gargarizans]
MKILVSSLLLLFLSGTYSAAVQTQEEKEPPAKPTIRETVKSLFHNVMVLGAELVANWESPEADIRAACEKRTEIIKGNYYTFAYSVIEYAMGIYKEVHEEMNAKYPVYTTKVLPVLVELAMPIYTGARDVVVEIQPSFKKFQDQVKIHQITFLDEIRPIVLKKAKSILDQFNERLKPFIKDVHKEVANAESKEDSKPVSEPEGLEESTMLSEFFQNLLVFDNKLLKNMQSELFSSKA